MIFTDVDGGTEFRVKVVPGSTRNRIVGPLGDMLKVAVNAPPEKGKANQAVVQLLADRLELAKNSVRIIAGETNPRKTIFVEHFTADECRKKLLE